MNKEEVAWLMPQGNSIAIIRQNDSGGPRHGGWRTYRHFEVYVNSVLFETFSDDCAANNYSSGEYLDKDIEEYLQKLSKALHCNVVRGRVKDFDPMAGAEPPKEVFKVRNRNGAVVPF